EAEKPTDSWISNHNLEFITYMIILNRLYCSKHIWYQRKYEDKCLNINKSTYTDDMFTSIMKDFCLEDADFITLSGELETACSRYRRQGLHEGFNEKNVELSLMMSEMNLSVKNFMKVGDTLLDIDKSKRGHKIDAAIGIRLMKENLIYFLIVESKKPGTDPSSDKRKQLQEQ
ncbi:18613_t:CDS:2, partial [Racocetra persica]